MRQWGSMPVRAGGCSADPVGAGPGERVFRVVCCPACFWQYGAWRLKVTQTEYWGDCPRCGGKTELRSDFLRKSRAAAGGPAGPQLGLFDVEGE